MGIALGTSATEELLGHVLKVFQDADDILAGRVDVNATTRGIKERMATVQSLLEEGRSSDRLEVFDGQTRIAAPARWYAHRVGANNEVRAVTEAYTREADAHRGGEGAFPDLAP
jgi:hypothetical protein